MTSPKQKITQTTMSRKAGWTGCILALTTLATPSLLMGCEDTSLGETGIYRVSEDHVIDENAEAANAPILARGNPAGSIDTTNVGGGMQMGSSALTIISPTNGSTVPRAIAIHAAVTDPSGFDPNTKATFVKLEGGNEIPVGECSNLQVSRSGTISCNLSSLLTAGSAVFGIRGINSKGEASAINTTSFTVDGSLASADAIAPKAPFISHPANGTTVGTSFRTYIAAERGATVSITIDGNEVSRASTDSTGVVAFQINGLSPGAHLISATATDISGNISPVGSSGIRVDSTTVDSPKAPATPSIVTPIAGSTVNGSIQISGVVPGGAGSSVSISIDGGQPTTVIANGQGQFASMAPSLSAGGHSVSVTATQNGGTSSAASASFTIGQAAPPTQNPLQAKLDRILAAPLSGGFNIKGSELHIDSMGFSYHGPADVRGQGIGSTGISVHSENPISATNPWAMIDVQLFFGNGGIKPFLGRGSRVDRSPSGSATVTSVDIPGLTNSQPAPTAVNAPQGFWVCFFTPNRGQQLFDVILPQGDVKIVPSLEDGVDLDIEITTRAMVSGTPQDMTARFRVDIPGVE